MCVYLRHFVVNFSERAHLRCRFYWQKKFQINFRFSFDKSFEVTETEEIKKGGEKDLHYRAKARNKRTRREIKGNNQEREREGDIILLFVFNKDFLYDFLESPISPCSIHWDTHQRVPWTGTTDQITFTAQELIWVCFPGREGEGIGEGGSERMSAILHFILQEKSERFSPSHWVVRLLVDSRVSFANLFAT